MMDYNKLKIFSKEEEYETFKRLQNAKDRKEWISIRNEIVKANVKWVIKVTSEYYNRGAEKEDLIQEGCKGLIRAVETFDPEKTYKRNGKAIRHRFNTYSTWWIRQAIRAFISRNSKLVKIPAHLSVKLNKILKKSEELNLPPNHNRVASAVKMDVRYIEKILLLAGKVISLDKSFGDLTLHDFLYSAGKDINEKIVENEWKKRLDIAIKKLDERDEKIVRMRFSLK